MTVRFAEHAEGPDLVRVPLDAVRQYRAHAPDLAGPTDVEALGGYSIVYGQLAVMCDACGAVIAGAGPTGKPSDLKSVVLAAVEHFRECDDDPDAEQRAALERAVMSREPI